MKFMHLGDLHLGKIVNEFHMLADQKFVLNQMLVLMDEEEVDAVLIAGDVYDRSIPPAEAVLLLNEFLTAVVQKGIQVFLIAGNHDSGERLDFGAQLLKKSGVHMVGLLPDQVEPIRLMDKYGPISLILLPFYKPSAVKNRLGRENLTYDEAVRGVVEEIPIDETERNVMITHHFVTSNSEEVECSDSENRLSVGGADNVDMSVFHAYDYVALGHIHGPQRVGRDTVRYAGSPLKYSFSEEFHHKSVAIVNLMEKGNLTIKLKELKPLHDMRRIKGRLKDLIADEVVAMADPNDYLGVTLTDDKEILDPIGILRTIYPNIMQLGFEKFREGKLEMDTARERAEGKRPEELVEGFFAYVTERDVDEERKKLIGSLVEQAEGRLTL